MLTEVTITLKPFMYVHSSEKQYELTAPVLQKLLLNRYQASCVAELTKQFNIHYHMAIELADAAARKRFCDDLRKIKWVGRTSIEMVRNDILYFTYMNKDIAETRSLIGKDPIIADSFGKIGVMKFLDDVADEDIECQSLYISDSYIKVCNTKDVYNPRLSFGV